MKTYSTSKPEQTRCHGSSGPIRRSQADLATAVADLRPEMVQQQGLLSLVSGSRRLQRACACGAPRADGGTCAAGEEKATDAGPQVLQKKLVIGAADDPLEREADRVADQVMRMETPSPNVLAPVPIRIQRLEAHSGAGTGIVAPSSVERVLAGPGRPLEPGLREEMELKFGYDFESVRVHTGVEAEQSLQEVNAHAYTVGHDIVLGSVRFSQASQESRQLVAHELTHVVQQNGESCGPVPRSMTLQKETDGTITDTILAKAFAAADSKRWEEAASLAERLSKYDLNVFLSQYKDPEQIYLLHLKALVVGGSESNVARATEVMFKTVKADKDLRYKQYLETQNGSAPPSEAKSQKDGISSSRPFDKIAKPAHDSRLYQAIVQSVALQVPGGLTAQVLSAAMYGFGAEMYHQLTDEQQGRFTDALKELIVPSNAADFAASLNAGTVAGVVSPVTDIFGLVALGEQLHLIVVNLSRNAWEKSNELMAEANQIGAQIAGLTNQLLVQFAELRKNPLEIFALLDALDSAAEGAGREAAKKAADYFRGKDEDFKGELVHQERVKDALLTTTSEEKAGVASFLASKFTRVRKAVFKTPWQKIGYNTGYAVGAVAINIFLLAATDGIGNLIVEISSGLGKIAPLLSGVEKALVGVGTRIAEVENGIALVLSTLLKPLSKATKWLEPVIKPLTELMERLGGFVRKLLGLPEKAATKALAQAGVKAAEEFGTLAPAKTSAIPEHSSLTKPASAPSALSDLKSADVVVHEPKGLPSTAKSSEKPVDIPTVANEVPMNKSPAEAVKYVEDNPKLIKGEPGNRRAPVGEGHEIIEVPDSSLPSGIGCELHSPPPGVKVPCPQSMGVKRREAFADDPDFHESIKELEDVPGAKGESMESFQRGNQSIQERTAQSAGMFNVDKHHVFPQERRRWFERRGMRGANDIDNFTLKMDKAMHQAQHGGGDWSLARREWEGEYNRLVMDELVKAEGAKRIRLGKRKALLTPDEIKETVFNILDQRQIPHSPVDFVKYRE
jgi:hypothetical protein